MAYILNKVKTISIYDLTEIYVLFYCCKTSMLQHKCLLPHKFIYRLMRIKMSNFMSKQFRESIILFAQTEYFSTTRRAKVFKVFLPYYYYLVQYDTVAINLTWYKIRHFFRTNWYSKTFMPFHLHERIYILWG